MTYPCPLKGSEAAQKPIFKDYRKWVPLKKAIIGWYLCSH
jgi:hypothetical protein